MFPEPALIERFRSDLGRLTHTGTRIGLAVSGGPDSLALMLLAAAAVPGQVEAATVDHRLRSESRGEADLVGEVCERLGVPHCILTAEWTQKPETALQERARSERYRLLAAWAAERGLEAIATAHQLDDQAETLVMRLGRGAGVRGLAGMRPVSAVPGTDVPLVRPLLGWRRDELERICVDAGLQPARDPGNEDERFERIRVRRALSEAGWLDASSLARSASHLGDADAALDWAVRQEWARAVANEGSAFAYRPGDAPAEIRRRIASLVIARLATEGAENDLRGGELDRLIAALESGAVSTIRGVLCRGGPEWRFSVARSRNG
jgi:tRNA(Ile)-lysidine synthase